MRNRIAEDLAYVSEQWALQAAAQDARPGNRERADDHRQADSGRGNPESSRPAVRPEGLTPQRLGDALHVVYCERRAPMHSAPDHSAAAILAHLSDTESPT